MTPMNLAQTQTTIFRIKRAQAVLFLLAMFLS